MPDRPDTRYAKAADGTSIAYQVVGDGPVDLVYASGIWSNLDLMWEEPTWARFLERLASFSRLILFDMRGVGLSDRGPEPPSIELQRDDVEAVLDAAGSDAAVMFGSARAASMALLFAATPPPDDDGSDRPRAPPPVRARDIPPARSPAGPPGCVGRALRAGGDPRALPPPDPSALADDPFLAAWGAFRRPAHSPRG